MNLIWTIRIGCVVSLLPMPLAAQTPPAPGVPAPAEMKALVAERVADPRVPGIAIARLMGEDRFLATGGRLRAADPSQVTSATVFEIGSITKAFTGLLLAEMVLRGEVALDDSVATHLPPGTRVPERDGIAITMRHLATHTSGLPRDPDNLDPRDQDDPYADYDAARLTAFLAAHQLRRAPGATYEYSNVGGGLLGWALANRADTTYGALLRERILTPLGMNQTGIEVTDAMRDRLATGHDGMGEPMAPWHFAVLAGAGALRSTLDDMLRFAAAARDTVRGPLARAMALSQREAFRIDSLTAVGLGWHRLTRRGRTLAWHNGATGGFRSMIVADPVASRAAVVLTNSIYDGDAIAIRLLDDSVKLRPLPPGRATVPVDAATLAKYPGRYRLTPAFVITITPRDTTGLHLQATGQQRFRLHASSPTEFFVTEVAASITFETDGDGDVVALVLHQGGIDQRAPREP